MNPGLLGSAKEFAAFTKRLAARPHRPFEPLRELVRPYVLRRLKTDRSVIADLPDKTEVKAFCALSRKQAALYAEVVKELGDRIAGAEGIAAQGADPRVPDALQADLQPPLALAGRRRLGRGGQREARAAARDRRGARRPAGEGARLHAVPRDDRTRSPRTSAPSSGAQGLVLHGETPVKKRQELVRRFQEDEAVPFFVLSLKAGGAGLNLTAASHVVHFDRWWNPAVENQATDRAFRIGQVKNVLVHKFVCRGTVEEKIDGLIESKQQLSRDVLEGGAERLLTEMKDDEILRPRRPRPARGLGRGVSDGLLRLATLRPRRRPAAAGGARDGAAPEEGAPGLARRDRGARHRRAPSGARAGAATSSATATTRTACRAGGPTSATAPSSTSRSRGAR